MIDNFLKIEEKYKLLDDNILGFSYWIYIRDKVFAYVEGYDCGNNTNEKANNKLDEATGSKVFSLTNSKITFKILLDAFVNCTIKNPFIYAKHREILIFPSPRRTIMHHKYYAFWTDIIQDTFDDISVSAEFLNVITHSKPYWNKNVIDMDYFDIAPFIIGRLLGRTKKKIKNSIKEKAYNLSKIFYKEKGINISCDYFTNLIFPRYLAWYYKKKMLSKFIRRISPRIIVEVCHYSTNCMIINEIANELNIKTIEMQHGIIGYGHLGYNYISDNNRKQLPQKLFVYSQYWKEHCRFPIGKDNIVSTGYYFSELQKEKFPPKYQGNNKIRFLVLSQHVFHDQFIYWIKKISEVLNHEGINYSIIIKPHPSECMKEKSWWGAIANNKRISVVNNPNVPLYYLFSVSDIQIGASSTALYEGLIYNLKTIILKFGNAKEQMKEIINEGIMEFCESTDNLEEVIKTTLNKSNNYISTQFFQENSAENIRKEIMKLL